jgi:stage II sporulation protein D
VVTYFSASSGGHTENVEKVWPQAAPEPWLRGVPDPYDDAGANPYHRWGYQMNTTAAAAKLGRLVKGRLVGIQVVEHGASPRILHADVVGTGGVTRVTGTQLQHIFGLLTTNATFTTISAQAGRPTGAGAIRHAAHESDAVTALVSLVHQMVAGVVPAIAGQVFPARVGDSVTVQARTAAGWQPIGQARIGGAGHYELQLPVAGTYRVLYRGLAGPLVSVS